MCEKIKVTYIVLAFDRYELQILRVYTNTGALLLLLAKRWRVLCGPFHESRFLQDIPR